MASVLREVRILADLEHVNVVRYYGAWIEDPSGLLQGLRTGKCGSVCRDDVGYGMSGGFPMSLVYKRFPDTVIGNKSLERTKPGDSMRIEFGQAFEDEPSTFTQDVVTPDIDTESSAPSTITQSRSEIETSGEDFDTPSNSDEGACMGMQSKDHKAVTMFIMMNLLPMDLKSFLGTKPYDPHQESGSESAGLQEKAIVRGHCFHRKASIHLFRGILEGVEHLHSRGIVHRDLKPGNIFLSLKGTDVDRCYCHNNTVSIIPKIGDFGLAVEIPAGELEVKCELAGTALYRPPPPSGEDDESEINFVCAKTDVYALGFILLELLLNFTTGFQRVVVCRSIKDRRTMPAPACWDEVVGDGRSDKKSLKEVEILRRCVMGMTDPVRDSRWTLEEVKAELRKVEGWLR